MSLRDNSEAPQQHNRQDLMADEEQPEHLIAATSKVMPEKSPAKAISDLCGYGTAIISATTASGNHDSFSSTQCTTANQMQNKVINHKTP